MQKRKLESLGIALPLLGFGCMRLPCLQDEKQSINEAEAQQMVDLAMAAGVNYFDTAWLYHEGESEPFLGRALQKYPRDSYYLATKMPTWDAVQTQEDVERIFAEQLKKCKVDSFDFYLLHCLNTKNYERAKRLDIYGVLKKKKQEGKIRFLGFSFHGNTALLEQIVRDYAWDFAQIQLNYLDWELMNAKRQYELLTENKIPVIVMEPVRGGILATLNEQAAQPLKEIHPHASLASWAIRYAASLPNVMTVLSGMSTKEQLEDNRQTLADFVPLCEEEYQALEKAKRTYFSSGFIPCTACRYCTDCPQNIDIPRLFSIYNEYSNSKNEGAFHNGYQSLPEGEKAHNCITCGVCVTHCPQNIDIPGYMKEIAAAVNAG